jgi:hypothetical protein
MSGWGSQESSYTYFTNEQTNEYKEELTYKGAKKSQW